MENKDPSQVLTSRVSYVSELMLSPEQTLKYAVARQSKVRGNLPSVRINSQKEKFLPSRRRVLQMPCSAQFPGYCFVRKHPKI